jgi:glyoxylase-like metal-dependent hydrolase (beta-lactamase superfamily II)
MRAHRIELPTPFAVGTVNAYLLEGEPLTLIDTGPKTAEAQAALEAGLAQYGPRVDDVRRIILTHGHVDHFGNAAWLRARSGAQIFAHPADAPKFAGERWVVEHLRRHFVLAGLPESFLGVFTDRMRELRQLYDPVTELLPLQDGDSLPVGVERVRVLHCPGHSLGHICLFHLEGILIAGDLLLADISPNPIVEFTQEGRRIATLPQYLHSLRRVLLLNCEVAYPGHGGPLGNPGARIRELIGHHEQRKDEIYRRLAAEPRTLVELAEALYPALDEVNLMLALSEVLGHLDLLAEEKRVTATRRGPAMVFRAK